MRAWLLEQLNSVYAKILLRLGKWTLVGLILTFLGFGALASFVFPRLLSQAQKSSNTQVVTIGGQSKVVYKDKAIPKNYREELDAQGPVMIYENQARSAKDTTKPDSKGRPEEVYRVEGVDVKPSERKALLAAVNRFLSRWETFEPITTDEEYRASISPFVSPAGLDDIAERKDNVQIDAISPGGQVGTRWVTDGFTPSVRMAVRRYDGQTAYITTVGEVVTQGPSLVMSDLRYLRSYALVMENTEGGWKVRRAVAQTLVQVLE